MFNILNYAGLKEEYVLFTKTLNTLYLRLYGVGHMAKDHSDSERGNPLLPYTCLKIYCVFVETSSNIIIMVILEGPLSIFLYDFNKNFKETFNSY